MDSFSTFAEHTLFSTVLASIFSFFALMFAEPKKQRIQAYNLLVDQFTEELRKTERAVIQYWSSEGQLGQLEAEIIAARNDCTRFALALNKRQLNFYNVDSINSFIYLYFKIVTGGSFQQKQRKANLPLLNEAEPVLKNLFNMVESSKYTYTFWNFITVPIG